MDMQTLLILALGLGIGIGVTAIITMINRRQSPADGMDQSGLAELKGQLDAITQTTTTLQNSMMTNLQNHQQTLNETLRQQAETTSLKLGNLNERLAVIDRAQDQLKALSSQTTRLENVLANNQARGAYGEIQLENLITQMLPASAYSFQHSLPNNKRADCLLQLPNPPGPIVIDAKFPLESWYALGQAEDDAAKAQARKQLEAAFIKHVKDISERYIIRGHTAESALMFVPSESIYAELHNHLTKALETSFAERVYIVSPTTLMAILNTVRAVLRDVRMRQQAAFIQEQVGRLLKDIGRLNDRVGKLDRHFNLAQQDIDDISKSTRAISRTGEKIEQIETDDTAAKIDPIVEPPRLDHEP
ncbi:MAG TPA: DNA recombination protein RmuC [Alphaproteobacteria bacterium]|nr:DNA recombination protein RmuC [Alphaproteobacteria bacterium]